MGKLNKKRAIKRKIFVTTRKEYFSEVLQRLENDVLPYVEYVQEPHEARYVGNFALIRMLMPVIESVAYSENRQVYRLLSDLRVPLPRLTWTMFRHGLSHHDNPIIVSWGKQSLSWSMAPAHTSHDFDSVKREVHIDCTELYEDLAKYLKYKIATTPLKKTKLTVRTQIVHPTKAEKLEFETVGEAPQG